MPYTKYVRVIHLPHSLITRSPIPCLLIAYNLSPMTCFMYCPSPIARLYYY